MKYMNGWSKVEEDLLFFIFSKDKKKESSATQSIFKNGIDKSLTGVFFFFAGGGGGWK